MISDCNNFVQRHTDTQTDAANNNTDTIRRRFDVIA